MKKIVSGIGLIGYLIASFTFIGCEEHPYKISINGEIPPAFKVKTNGSLYFVRIVKSPAPESEIYPNEAGIWQIEPDKKKVVTYPYPEIKYGVVPDGFIQKVPQDGSAPAALTEGQEYLFFAPPAANIKGVKFKIENGRSVIVD